MAIVEVLPGACGFKAQIGAKADANLNVSLEISSDCAHIRQLAAQLGRLSPLDEVRLPIAETTPYRLAGRCWVHAACPVPSAILKAMEVAAEMALPSDVHISIRRV